MEIGFCLESHVKRYSARLRKYNVNNSVLENFAIFIVAIYNMALSLYEKKKLTIFIEIFYELIFFNKVTSLCD